jgi:antitoxin component YwqK of YwqJK toxin-antitoxin module
VAEEQSFDASGKLTFETGEMSVVISFQSGSKEGVARFVSSEGNVLVEADYEKDELEGDVKQYYPSGSLLSAAKFSGGKQTGEFKTFFENGMPQIVAQYKAGKMHGNFRAFDEFGDIVQECTYSDGKKEGKNTIYYTKSQGGGVYEVSFYENGLLSGDKVSFYPTGEVMTFTPYHAGKAQMYTKNYTKSGKEI